MECPEGIDCNGEEVLLLLKSINSLVQAARQFFNKFNRVLTKVGFTQSKAEPCLFYKRFNDHMIVIIIHVDD